MYQIYHRNKKKRNVEKTVIRIVKKLKGCRFTQFYRTEGIVSYYKYDWEYFQNMHLFSCCFKNSPKKLIFWIYSFYKRIIGFCPPKRYSYTCIKIKIYVTLGSILSKFKIIATLNLKWNEKTKWKFRAKSELLNEKQKWSSWKSEKRYSLRNICSVTFSVLARPTLLSRTLSLT